MRALLYMFVVFAALLLIGAAFLYQGDLPAAYVDQKYQNEASRFLLTESGARLHYRDQGEGMPIVLIHGSSASLHTWEPWTDLLADGYRVITLDLPGHGLTGRVPGDDYSAAANVSAVASLVSKLQLEHFVLGGNSMGGGVSWAYALEFPEQVRALILVASSAPASWWRAENNPSGRSPLAFTLLGQAWFRAIGEYLDPWALVYQGVQVAYNDAPMIDDALVRRYYELALREGSRAATMARFAAFDPSAALDPDLSRLTQPVLVMWGAQDALIPVNTADQFEQALPDATVVIYEDLGHVPMEEAPARTAADLRQFLESLNEMSASH